MGPAPILALLLSGCLQPAVPLAKGDLDLDRNKCELVLPPITDGPPCAGSRVRVTAPGYEGTDVHHLLYLPTDWNPGGSYPVLVEYSGNGPYRNEYGDTSTGEVDGSCLGYGISGGHGFIWLVLPFVDETGMKNERQWWGSVERTVDYCKRVVPRVCEVYGGDPDAVLFLGFSRGAIAGNFIGLHDDEVASLWRGFVLHSHYDGVRSWPYEGSDRQAAAERLARLRDRPQWISHEESIEETRRYLEQVWPGGPFTLRALPFQNHTDRWVLMDHPSRDELRTWVDEVLERD